MTIRIKRAATATAAVAAAVLLASCSTGTDESPVDEGPVTIAWWSGLAGSDDIAAQWNAEHPDIQVEHSDAPGSWQDQAAKLTAALKAGEAPCVAMMENPFIPSLAVAGALLDVTDEVAEFQGDYIERTWDAVTFGGQAFGVPQGTGPMAMFYRADRLEELGIDVPTTWDEFYEASKAVAEKAPGTYLTGMGADDGGGFVSLAAQHSDPWFGIDGDSWVVDIDNEATRDVADYWQKLRDEGLLNLTNRWDPTFYNDLSEGRQLAVIGGSWQADLIADNVTGGAGSWAVAPMPSWDGGQQVSAPNGGSSVIAIAGCEHPAQAMEFAHFITSDADTTIALGGFPAATLDSIPERDATVDFFGGQQVNQEIARIAETVAPWTWSPTWNETKPVFDDGMGGFKDQNGTLRELLTKLQKQQVDSMTAAGVSVTEK
ncbi:MAG: extracellular solute-binding protein [Salana multivorans]|uniref:ABC transporter substrate-binding protein n=1 Tax=Salana multivorans TaxID=120377 RepID=UPI000A71568D|nr:extracellular solute-binding protein [Salana multivorans]MBN8882219.1 extracellular solute-binding protein [Salana multivorans]